MIKPTLLLLPLLFLLGACAPRLQDIGPDIATPALTDSAMRTADGVELPLRTWLPKDKSGSADPVKGVIVALHGFNDYSRGMEVPGAGMARRGYAVYAYDQRGFGETPQRGIWPGESRLAADLRLAVALLREKHPDQPVFVLGESMGAAVAMATAAAEPGLDVEGLILVSPATWGWETLTPAYRRLLEFGAQTIPWMTVRPTTLRVQASNNISALRKMSRDRLVIKDTRIDAAYGLVNLMSTAYRAIPLVCDTAANMAPCFVAYGGREDVLDKGAVAESIGRFRTHSESDVHLALYRNGHHLLLRDLESRKTFDDIAAWLATQSKL